MLLLPPVGGLLCSNLTFLTLGNKHSTHLQADGAVQRYLVKALKSERDHFLHGGKYAHVKGQDKVNSPRMVSVCPGARYPSLEILHPCVNY